MASSRGLGTLTLDLVARIAGFTGPLDKAGRDAEKRFRDMEKRAKQFGAVLGGAMVAGATALAASLKASIDRMDELSKSAQRAQLPTEEFSRLSYAADLADVSMQDIVTSMGRLARAQSDAERGLKTQQQAFERLGIAYKNADGSLRSSIDVFRDFANVYQRFEGKPEVLAAGMQIFGRSFQNLIPLLRGGAEGLAAAAEEADKLGYTISTEAGQQAEEFNDNITRLKTVVMGLSNAIAADLLPDLVRLSGGFLDSAKEGERLKQTAQGVTDFLRGLATMAHVVSSAFEVTGTAIATVVAQAQGAAKFFSGDFAGGIELYRQASLGLDAEVREALGGNKPIEREVKLNFITADSGGIPESAKLLRPNLPDILDADKKDRPKRGGGKSEAEREAESLKRSYESLMESMHERIELFGKEGEAARVRYQVEFGELSNLTPELQANVIARAEQYDQMVRMEDMQKAADKAVEDATKKYQDERDAINELVASLQAEALWLAATTDERYRLEAAQLAGAAATDEDREAIERLLRTRDDMAQMDRGWQDFSSSLADGIFDIASGAKSAEDAIKSFFDTLAKQITNSIAEDWAKSITDMFKGMGQGGSGSGAGGFFSNLLGSLFGGGRANGGQVSAGRFYEVGEADRPELLMSRGKQYLIPGNQGTVVPMQGRGGGSITQNFINPRSIDMETEAQKARRRARIYQRSTARLS